MPPTPAQRAALDQVAAALRAESFPTTKENLYYAVGDLCLEADDGHEVPVRDVLDVISTETFERVDDAVTALTDGLGNLPPVARHEPPPNFD